MQLQLKPWWWSEKIFIRFWVNCLYFSLFWIIWVKKEQNLLNIFFDLDVGYWTDCGGNLVVSSCTCRNSIRCMYRFNYLYILLSNSCCIRKAEIIIIITTKRIRAPNTCFNSMAINSKHECSWHSKRTL